MKRRGRRLTHVTSECGCQYRTSWSASELAGASTDCPRCDATLLFPADIKGTAVRAERFREVRWREVRVPLPNGESLKFDIFQYLPNGKG